MNNPGLISILAAGNETFRKLNAGVLSGLEDQEMAKHSKPRKSKGNALSYAHNQTPLAAGLPAGQPQSDLRKPLLGDHQAKQSSAAGTCVVITRCSCGSLDRDNLYSSVKPLVDALRNSGQIIGDTERDIDLYVFQKKVKRKEAGTLIEIILPSK